MLAGNTGFSNNITQDLFEKTARTLFTIVKSTATDQEAVDNVATNTAGIATHLQDTINAMKNIRARLDAIELSARNENCNGNAGCTRTQGGGVTTTSHIVTCMVELVVLTIRVKHAGTRQKDMCQRQPCTIVKVEVTAIVEPVMFD